jgi:hypothetical protein
MNNQTKTLLAVVAVLLLIYFLYNRQGRTDVKPVMASGTEAMTTIAADDGNNSIPENMENVSVDTQSRHDNVSVDSEHGGPIPKEDMARYFPQRDYAPPESDWMRQKFGGRDKAMNGYKHSSYADGIRGELGPAAWQSYFDANNNVFSNAQTGDNDKFLPIDETNGGFAVFKSKGRAACGSNQVCSPEDLFDVDKYLPQEVNNDYWNVPPEPVSIKNRHLVNITRPIGVNTIGSSNRNQSYDIRGSPACPSAIVSPFLQSSISPDQNLKPLF